MRKIAVQTESRNQSSELFKVDLFSSPVFWLLTPDS